MASSSTPSSSASAEPSASTPAPRAPLGYRAAAEDVPDAIERLLRAYLADRAAREDLRAYFARHDDAALRATLNGEVIDPVERDAPPVGAGRFAPGE